MQELSAEQKQQIEGFILTGQKIQAIKVVREATGCDLLTAKQAVEAFETHLREASPEKFAPKGKGCMTGVVFLLALGAGLAFWLV